MELDQLKQQLFNFLEANRTQEFSAKIIADGLRMNDTDQQYKFVENALKAIVRDGNAEEKDGKYQFKDATKGILGNFRGNDKGFGFVRYDPELPDMFIPASDTLNAMSGDTVRVDIVEQSTVPNKGPVAKVVEIVEHAFEEVVGVFNVSKERQPYIGYIDLVDKKVLGYRVWIKKSQIIANDGEMVVAKVTNFPSDTHPKELIGYMVSSLGYADEPGVDILRIVHTNKVPDVFPEDVLEEAAKIPAEISEEDMVGRPDFRDQMLITIDGADTKDIDDAVVAWKLSNGNYHLGVHIADVTHYVRPGTALDREAFNRGTSVYLTNKVIPMLPRNISNGIASLNPGVDRLAMSCEMEIDPSGKVVNHKIQPSVIRSHYRMTYETVNKILDGDVFAEEENQNIVPMIKVMGELHEILTQMRDRRGAIEFEVPEAKIICDENGRAVDIELRERDTAEKMIESFMLAANETVAEHYDKLNVPFLYRVHEKPEGERAQKFFEFSSSVGYPIYGDPNNLKPAMFQNVIKEVEGTQVSQMISTMMLRAMKQAKYSPEPIGHFGIGAEYYTHFTSPIRRYPDLMVHRLIKWYKDQGITEASKKKYEDQLEEIGEATSEKERRAIDTERAVNDMKKAEYMEGKEGLEFDGIVSSAMPFGLFVTLENTVDGLVHISNMTDDRYDYIEDISALVGQTKHHIFTIGQPVKVEVIRVNKEERVVDFKLLNPEDAPTTDIRYENPHKNKGDKRPRNNKRKPGNKRNPRFKK